MTNQKTQRMVAALAAVIAVALVAVAVAWWFTKPEPTYEELQAERIDEITQAGDEELEGTAVDLEVTPKNTAWRGVNATATVPATDPEAVRTAADFLERQYSQDETDPDYVTGRISAENPPTSYSVDPRLDTEWIVGLLAEPIEGMSNVSVVRNNADTGEGNRSDRIDLAPEVEWDQLDVVAPRVTEIVDAFVPSFDAEPFVNLQKTNEEGDGEGPMLSLHRADGDIVAPSFELMGELMAQADPEQVSSVIVRNTGGQLEVEIRAADGAEFDQAEVEGLVEKHLPGATVTVS